MAVMAPSKTRGRPRKIIEEDVQPIVSQVDYLIFPKKRGRPRKTAALEENLDFKENVLKGTTGQRKTTSLESLTSGKSNLVIISAPRLETVTFKIVGTAPYMQSTFSEKARNKMMSRMEAGGQAKSKKQRDPRNFDADYEAATHYAEGGWPGIPAGAFRTAMISACRLVNYKMTLAKLSIFIEHDGLDKAMGVPLVKINGKREKNESPVRNETGVCDIRARPIWRKWNVDLRVMFDVDQFSLSDVTNLLNRAGQQVGVGEGRPDSRNSTGIGFGTFKITN